MSFLTTVLLLHAPPVGKAQIQDGSDRAFVDLLQYDS